MYNVVNSFFSVNGVGFITAWDNIVFKCENILMKLLVALYI